jgi:UDP-glucose:(heptosyl)LPS alpha-1,3-glucosyltransferase
LFTTLERQLYSREEIPLAVISRKTAVDLARHFGRTNDVSLVYYGIDQSQFSPEICAAIRPQARRHLGLPDAVFALLLIGNDWKKKGLGHLLEALDRMGEPLVWLLVVGRDEPAPYQSWLDRPSLAGRVRFFPPRPDVQFYYAAADTYVCPSLEDAFALPPAEAMACGLPVIVSRQAGASEIVTHGVDALILENPNDPDELCGLIRRLHESAEFRAMLGQKAHLTSLQYTWERNANEMRAIMESALERKRQQSGRVPG